MTKLSPTVSEVWDLLSEGYQGPIVMLNLLQFKPVGGEDAHYRYMAAAKEAEKDLVGEGYPPLHRLFSGPVTSLHDQAGEWNRISLVQYRDCRHLADLMLHPKYRNLALPIRRHALLSAIFLVTFPTVEVSKDTHDRLIEY